MDLKELARLAKERSKVPMTEDEVRAMAERVCEMEKQFAAEERAQRPTPELLNKICNM